MIRWFKKAWQALIEPAWTGDAYIGVYATNASHKIQNL